MCKSNKSWHKSYCNLLCTVWSKLYLPYLFYALFIVCNSNNNISFVVIDLEICECTFYLEELVQEEKPYRYKYQYVLFNFQVFRLTLRLGTFTLLVECSGHGMLEVTYKEHALTNVLLDIDSFIFYIWQKIFIFHCLCSVAVDSFHLYIWHKTNGYVPL